MPVSVIGTVDSCSPRLIDMLDKVGATPGDGEGDADGLIDGDSELDGLSDAEKDDDGLIEADGLTDGE